MILSERYYELPKFLSVMLVSSALHLTFIIFGSTLQNRYPEMKDYVPIHISSITTEPEEIKKEEPLVKKPTIHHKKAVLKNPIEHQAKATRHVKPVQGLPPSQVSSKGIPVPVGNTLMAPDEGKHLDAKDIDALPTEGEDLSTQPKLVRSSVELPQYTEEALDNNLEGTFEVEVFVDENGNVSKAELKKKIGFGMDERVLDAARKVHFVAGHDRLGKTISQWSEIKFLLQIP